MIPQKIFKYLHSIMFLVFIVIPYKSFAMNGCEDKHCVTKIDSGIIEYWVNQFVELDNDAQIHKCEDLYLEIAARLNDVKPYERLQTLLDLANEALKKRNKRLSTKLSQSLHELYNEHFKGTSEENYVLAQIQAVGSLYSTLFLSVAVPERKRKRSGGKEKEKEKETGPEHETAILDNEFCQTFKEMLFPSIDDPEVFHATAISLLDSLVSNDPSKQFAFIEALIKKMRNEDLIFAQSLSHITYNLYTIYFKGTHLDKHYKERRNALANKSSFFVKDDDLSVDDFQELGDSLKVLERIDGPLPPSIMKAFRGECIEPEELPTRIDYKMAHERWANRLELKGVSRANAIIGGVLFNSLKNTVSYIRIPQCKTIGIYRTEGFPLLITKNIIPYTLAGIRKETIDHPITAEPVSLLWSTISPEPSKTLLLGEFFIRSFPDGAIEVDDFKQKTSFSFKDKQEGITSLLAYGNGEFVTSSKDGFIKKFNLKEKKCLIRLPTANLAVKGLSLIHGILYGVINNGIYSFALTEGNTSISFPLYWEDDAEIICVADGSPTNLCIGLSNGMIKVFEDVIGNSSSAIKVSENPIENISMQKKTILAQDKEGIIVLY